jgi:hypothetical protein
VAWVLDPLAFMVCPLERAALARPDLLPVDRLVREPVARDDSMALDSFGPAVMARSRLELPERISTAQSVTCSLRRLICSLISFRFDHRNTPAATAPAAAAAVFTGLSLAVSVQ